MATVSHFVPSVHTYLLCSKGGSHEQQPLNLVCLDPLCRSDPLSCCVCFTTTHKYHKVTSLNKFLDEYKRNIRNLNRNMLQRKINKQYTHLKQHIHNFRLNFLQQMDNFEKALQKYAQYLTSSSHIRGCIKQQLHIQLQPQQISKLKSTNELENSVRFILNNCFYDSNLNMVHASDILKQNQQRVCALLDKMVYMTQFCQTSINQALKTLKFANQTLQSQKTQFNNKLDQLMNAQSDPTSLKHHLQQKLKLKKLIEQTGPLVLQESQKVQHMHSWNNISRAQPKYLFSKNRHKDLILSDNGTTVSSNVQSNKIYALGWPNINSDPLALKEWFVKINKCRDFASQNTLAIGISCLSDMKLAHYKGNPTNCLLVSSQGYITLNGKSQKTNFIFREGDTIHFRYDPHYETIQITKQNGRKLTLRGLGNEQPVYACVRFTYASDQVQFV